MPKKKSYELPQFDLGRLLNHLQGLVNQAPDGVVQFVVDLFCGAGGTSEGIEQSTFFKRKCSAIVAGINHDIKAIYSQAINHPNAYYTSEDIKIANLQPIKELLAILRERFPQCPIIIWASLECTNHSNAKGGQSRDADSRTLAWDMNRYVEELDPDGIWIENVKEFLIWGPLIEQEKWMKKDKKVKNAYPPSKAGEMDFYLSKINGGEIGYCDLHFTTVGKGKYKRIIDYGPTWVTDWRFAGTYFDAWTKEIADMGYDFQHRILNAADYGTPTNRHRLFLLFMRKGWPIAWPESTHSKEGGTGLFAKEKHVPVRTCINFDVEGRSVFEDGHVESDKTWMRLYEGLIKFVAGGKDAFMHQRNGGISRLYSLDVPARVVTTTGGNQEYVNVHFITKYMGNNQKTGSNAGKSLDEPSITVTTQNRMALVQAMKMDTAHWLMKYFSSHNNTKVNSGQSIDQPSPTITTRATSVQLVDVKFLDVSYGKGFSSAIWGPAPTLRTKDHLSLVQAVKAEEFLLNYQGQSRANSVDELAPSLMTKEKLALIGVKYFIYKAHTEGQTNSSIDEPCGALTSIPKADLVQVEGWIGTDNYDNKGSSLEAPLGVITASRHYHYLYNPAWFGSTNSIDEPCITIVASQDKVPPKIVSVEQMTVPLMAIPVFQTDSDIVIKIKEFMVMYDIFDIKKRMLMVSELLKIQSFPEHYFLAGTQTDKKKFIGNAVPPKQARAISESMYGAILKFIKGKIKNAA